MQNTTVYLQLGTMRLGVFGGSFDPVHYGHLLLAERCREGCDLDQVAFVPAAVAPHKREGGYSSGEARLAMLQLAIADHPAFTVLDLELARGGLSYTTDTLETLSAGHRQAELYLLLGADSLADLPNWHRPERIVELATLVAVGRPDVPPPDEQALTALTGSGAPPHVKHVEMPLVEFSSTELRSRVAAGQSIRYLTPPAVADYIREHRLYCQSASSSGGGGSH